MWRPSDCSRRAFLTGAAAAAAIAGERSAAGQALPDGGIGREESGPADERPTVPQEIVRAHDGRVDELLERHKQAGPSVYVTGYTPFDHTIEFGWG